jgi:hypothetical protein
VPSADAGLHRETLKVMMVVVRRMTKKRKALRRGMLFLIKKGLMKHEGIFIIV